MFDAGKWREASRAAFPVEVNDGAELGGLLETVLHRMARRLFTRFGLWSLSSIPVYVLIMTVVMAAGLPQVRAAFSNGSEFLDRILVEGSDLQKNVQYVQEHAPSTDNLEAVAWMLVSADDGSSVFTKEFLELGLNLSKKIQDATATKFGRTWRFGDVCKRLTLSTSTVEYMQSIFGYPTADDVPVPCLRTTPMDCFEEGLWDIPQWMFLSGIHTTPPSDISGPPGGLKLFADYDDSNLSQAYAHGCANPISGKSYAPSRTFFGQPALTDADWCVGWTHEDEQYQYLPGSQCVLSAGMSEWRYYAERKESIASMNWTDDEGNTISLSEDDALDLIGEVTNAMKAVMDEAPFVAQMLHNQGFLDVVDDLSTPPILTYLAALLVVLAVAVLGNAMPGAGGCLLGEGLLGFFVVLFTVPANMGLIGLFLTGVDTSVINAVPVFSLAIGVDDLFVYIQMYHTVKMCPGMSPEERAAQSFSHAFVSVTLTSLCNACLFASIYVIPVPQQRTTTLSLLICVVVNYISLLLCLPPVLYCRARLTISKVRTVTDTDDTDKDAEPRHKRNFYWFLAKVRTAIYATIYGRVTVVVVFFVLCIFSISQASKVVLASRITEVLTDDTDISKALNTWFDFQDTDNYNVYFKVNEYDLAQVQVSHDQIMEILEQHYNNNNSCARMMDELFVWAETFRPEYLTEVCVDGIVVVPCPEAGEDNSGLTYKNIIIPELFYEAFDAYSSTENKHPLDSVSTIIAELNDWDDYKKDANGDFILTWAYCSVAIPEEEDIGSYQGYTFLSDRLRSIADRVENVYGLSGGFASGINMRLVIALESVVITAFLGLAIGLTSVFFASLLLLRSFVGATLLVVNAFCVVVITFGLMPTFEIFFNMNSCLVLMMAVGLSIEVSAHMVVPMIRHAGTPVERTIWSLRLMGFPVFMGALSSVCGVLPFLSNPIPYIRVYFCHLLLIIDAAAIFIGIMVMPVLYTFLAWPCSRKPSQTKEVAEETPDPADEEEGEPPNGIVEATEESDHAVVPVEDYDTPLGAASFESADMVDEEEFPTSSTVNNIRVKPASTANNPKRLQL